MLFSFNGAFKCFVTLFVLLITPCLVKAGTFGLNYDGSGGYETGLYSPASATYTATSPFIYSSFEPDFRHDLNPQWQCQLTTPLSGTFRSNSSNDLSGGSMLALVRKRDQYTLGFKVSADYSKEVATELLDQSRERLTYKLISELAGQERIKWKVSYTSSLMNDLEVNRNDFGNRAKIKLSLYTFDWYIPSLVVGAGFNYSTIQSYTYQVFDVTLLNTLFIGERHVLMGTLYFDRRNYPYLSPTTALNKNVLSSLGLQDYVSNTTNMMLAYSYSLNEKLDLELSYDFSLFALSSENESDVSHKIGAGFYWQIKSL